MNYVTQFITPDDFKTYFGIDLGAQLKGNANPSDKANAFIKRIEDRMEAFLNANFFKNINIEYALMSDYQKDHYRLALLEQALYVFKNGDISVDSGYDPDQGIIVSSHALNEVIIGKNAKNHLRLCGLWTGHIGSGGFFGPWVI